MKHKLPFGRTLIIANPRAQSGGGAAVAERLQRFLSLYLDDARSFELVRTERPRHATELAEGAAGFETVIALGGDGVIHEVVCGLMRIDAPHRPMLGVVPVGSGNDYAQTLGIATSLADDFAQILTWSPQVMDVGRIVMDAGTARERTEHFVETCSFGLDAAIAHDTYKLRKRTHLAGGALYTLSGLRIFGGGYRSYQSRISFDGSPAEDIASHTFAIQIGPTYGSGFRVCPDADPADGVFDICYADGPTPRIVTLPVFLAARSARHVGSKHIHLRRARTLRIAFPEDGYPIQTDGERIEATTLDVSCLPGALTVLAPHRS